MSNAAMALRQDDASELSCVVIPIAGRQLLLPNVCVAEIMPWRRIKTVKDRAEWCMGYLGWRGQTIPVLNFAGFDAQPVRIQSGRCMIVMNRARNSTGPAFYALVAEGLPRMVQLTEEDLVSSDATLGPADVMCIKVGTEDATIPDLGFLERNVAALQTISG